MADAKVGIAEGEVAEFPMRSAYLPIPFNAGIKCNPVTSAIGIIILWGLAIYCMVDPEGSLTSLTAAKAGTTYYFTWLYIVTTPIIIFFMAYLYIFHGNQKLGKDHEKPEFGAGSYFSMIFSAGVGIGLFFYGVSEPLWHLSDNRFDTGFHSQAEYGVHAINLTLYHWGLGAWAPYVLVGIAAGIASYRENLPLTMRSCIYPVLGEYTWGFWGDLVDGFSIVVVVSGVCTSLGLGAIQIVDGVNLLTDLGLVADSEEENTARIIAIWIVTGAATLSVVSGLNFGIKFLSILAILASFVLCFLVLFLDDTRFILNLMVEACGWYFQYNVVEVAFATDAFGQLTRGNGRGIDGSSMSGLGAYAAWMNDWTIFYWAWWTAWSSFVGLFIARISRGRTIREVIHFTFAGPLLYAFIWFSTFGGAGIRAYYRVREVIQLGTLQGDADMYAVSGIDGSTCYAPPAYVEVTAPVDGVNITWTFENEFPGISPVCGTIGDISWWNVLHMYYDYGPFLSWVAIFSIAIYFVTSSDSGSLIVDLLANNGRDEPGFWIQRVFWAMTEGAVATALLMSGKSDALKALQAASIVAGLPFTVLLCTVCIGLYRFVHQHAEPEKYEGYNQWKMSFAGGVYCYIDTILSCGGVFSNADRSYIHVPDMRTNWETLRALCLPPWSVLLIMNKLNPGRQNYVSNMTLAVVVGGLFAGWIFLFISSVAKTSLLAFAWLCYFSFAFILAILRYEVRAKYNIIGNIGEDVGAGIIGYYQLLAQILIQLDEEPPALEL
ncbi:Hypothetical Protein FCC1311_037442 [Hondaea fermentalgiana]|uniref:Glycine betaine transporter OpuD n=1 Tax=Hondaea fermentalgiana TaxID=2315210 RepID=A0A2R5GGX5_9STRA|nr:Hypothetical Protein FCC1311_037442 [Hondaea fermentalgiana]|eukprot:GBG27521.1 Hypothetical Protein FCC1311_037442 [Hondaea fermentalgiana]